MGFLTVNDVTYSYQGKRSVINRVSWEIEKGEFHCLLGKSGCGKTTLLKLAAGLLQVDAGIISLNGDIVINPSPEAGFVFQSPTLLEWKNCNG
ncbi:UNVERIFIED_ORG: ABC-type nitrate/sulfonate/bicarbonate transport system ATPase subunit [Bacillus sp. B2I3]|nr:ABC-type nitrate/sulfonate/bicarbonate transport system ATPase subunit [Bacillus sp. B2I3]